MKTTLETSGEDENYTRNECILAALKSDLDQQKVDIEGSLKALLESSGEDLKSQVYSTRSECIFASSPLVSSVFSHLLHSF